MFLVYILSTLYAFPIHATAPSNATVLDGCTSILALNDSRSPNTPAQRTLFSILWSCILTVTICAWSSVHPNLPPRSKQWTLLRRMMLMFWMTVAPELVLAWAVRQWFAAREARDAYNGHIGWKCWTTEHGHFLNMGGYQLVDEEFKKYGERGKPGLVATPEDLDNYDAYQKRKQTSQLGVLTLDRFKQLIQDPTFKFPTITAAEIKDRSKGDELAKLIAILQTSWFIIQCVARGVQHLAVTQLELMTLATAILNAITFAFWWSKPLGVQEPVNVYIPAGATEEKGEVKEEVEPHDSELEIKAGDVIRHMIGELREAFVVISIFPFKIRNFRDLAAYLVFLPYSLLVAVTWPIIFLFLLGIFFLLWLIKTKNVEESQPSDSVATRVRHAVLRLRYNLTHSTRKYFGNEHGPLRAIADHLQDFLDYSLVTAWFFVVPTSFCLLVFILILFISLTLVSIASFIFTAVFELVSTNKVTQGATHVPTFYSPRTKSDRYFRMIVFAIFGVIFGGIHCIGWNFFFPTRYEREIRRYTSVVLTATMVAAPIDYILENHDMDKGFAKIVRVVLHTFMTAFLFAYVPARLSLIAQAFALLRDQPPTAFLSVDWTKYIPHLASS